MQQTPLHLFHGKNAPWRWYFLHKLHGYDGALRIFQHDHDTRRRLMKTTEPTTRECPFCASGHVGIRSRVNQECAPKYKYLLFVQCGLCGARGSGIPLYSLDEFLPDQYDRSIKVPGHIEHNYNVYRIETRGAAIRAWNECPR